MVKAVNKFKTAEFLAQQALKAAKAAARQTEQSVLTQPLGLEQTAQPTASKQASKQAASKSRNTHQTIPLATAPAIAQSAARNLHATHQTEAATGRHATALLTEQPASTRNKRGLNMSAAEPAEGSKHDQTQAKKPKLAKRVAVPTIFAAPAPQGKPVNSNWEALKSIVAAGRGKQKAAAKDHVAPAQDRPAVLQTPQQLGSKAGVTPVVAIDCEMVGVGPDGTRSALARVCMVNNDGSVLMDEYVQPQEAVTDYRTAVSGILPSHLKDGAISMQEAQQQVANVLKGRILVGHSVHHDLQALLLSHPRKMTRDTATYPPLMMSFGRGSKPKPRSLRHLAETELGLAIQAGEHSPVDDARSTLYLYHKHRKVWELHLQQGTLRELAAPRLMKKAVLQQMEEAKAAGIDADFSQQPTNRSKSLAQLAENDDMVDL